MEDCNEAEKAFRGDEQYVQFGEWTNITEKMRVVFEGVQPSSACRYFDSAKTLQVSYEGEGTHEIIVSPGGRVYAQAVKIKFELVI
jgi:hypothetical protein